MRFAAILFAVLLATAAFAVVPPTMTYQGIFTDTQGNVMPDGVYEEVGFHIMHSPVGGPPVWSEWQDITVSNGVFEVTLGLWNPLTPADFLDPQGDGLWLSISYNNQWMQPRQRINSVPFAFIACVADTARNLGVHTEQSLNNFITTTNDNIAALLARAPTAFVFREDNDISIEEDDETTFSSTNFTLAVASLVNFWGTVGDVASTEEGEYADYTTIRVDIVRVTDGAVVASTITTGAALPGSPSVQSFSSVLPAGTYRLEMELFCEEQAVNFRGYELGAAYQSAVSAR